MTSSDMSVTLLNPIERPAPIHAQLAPRLTSLAGITVALLDNSKTNSDRLLDMIGERLIRDYGVAELVRHRKYPHFQLRIRSMIN
ncbi:MAG: hypothetical protein O3A51_13380 [Verrucomicrobia bacterium]|nr:hypothetical protein [Verrucomicrobiota bacterium]